MLQKTPCRQRVASDLEDQSIGLHQQNLIIDLIGDYALHGGGQYRSNDVRSETIYAAMLALAALNRETRANIDRIAGELRTEKGDDD